MLTSRPRNSIHIKNLPDTITYNDVWLEFGKHGEIVNVTIPTDIVTGKSKGYAFVDYQSSEDATKALTTLNGVRLWGNILTIEYSRSFPKTSREMALRALNSNGQMGPIWPQIPLVARSSLPAPLIRRRLSPSSESSYSSHSSTRSHSRRRSRRRHHSRIRHYSSKDSSCYSSSSGRSTSCSRSSTRSSSYRRGDRRRPRRRSISRPRLPSHHGYSRRFPTSQRGNRNHSRRYRSGSYSRSCSSRSRSRSVTRKSCTNNNSVVKSCSNHLPLPSVRSSHRSLSSGSEGEVSDFVEEDFEPCQRVARMSKDRSRPDESDGSHSSHPDDVDIPDSLVIQANLIRSPPTSGGSFYSASTSSSRYSGRIFRNERSIDHRRSPLHTPSSSSSAVSSRNTKRSGPLSRSWSSDA